MDWKWQECDAPEGLDVGALGQTPFQHGERWYVKHPDTGQVLGAIPPGLYTSHTLNPFLGLKPPASPPVMATLGAALQQIGADIGQLSAKLGASAPPELQTLVTDCAAVLSGYSAVVLYAQNLEKELAAGKAGGKPTTTPTTTGASTGLSKGALAGLVGTGAAIAGFAGGFAAGRMTASHDGKDKPRATTAARD